MYLDVEPTSIVTAFNTDDVTAFNPDEILDLTADVILCIEQELRWVPPGTHAPHRKIYISADL